MKPDQDKSKLPEQRTTPSDLDPDVLQAALDQAYNAVIVTEAQLDPPGPRIVYANPAFARQTGYAVEELIGQTPRILQGPDTDPVMLTNTISSIASFSLSLGACGKASTRSL